MGDLINYLDHDVIIIDTDNNEWYGYVVLFDPSEDNDNGEDSIAFRTPQKKGVLIEFSESEIKSIKKD